MDVPASDRSERLNALIATYLEAVQVGQSFDRQEIVSQHPDLADELRSFFENHDRMRNMAAPAESPTLPPQTRYVAETTAG